jgi:mRNA-degrading endonuclease RelE of RelBE toxin-antitoxin system
MDGKYVLVFDEVILKQLKKVAKQNNIKVILSKMFDKLELGGPSFGKLLDSKIHIYEIKNKHPPIRLYFKHEIEKNEIYVFEFEMKKSEKKQNETIQKLKNKLLKS